MPNKSINKNPFLISGTIQKIMLQMTWKDQSKDPPICIGILFTEDEGSPNYKRHIMTLDENNISDFKLIKEQLSLTYEELMEVIDKLFYAKIRLSDFKDKLIPDIFYLSNPVEKIKNSDESLSNIMEKYYHSFVNKKENEQEISATKVILPKM